ncbi:MAG TPA: hypothetical protein VN905_08900 [Candidatus Binatia bacterium]|nr:hypothetical protein [Candidatus Binatia bacterium]
MRRVVECVDERIASAAQQRTIDAAQHRGADRAQRGRGWIVAYVTDDATSLRGVIGEMFACAADDGETSRLCERRDGQQQRPVPAQRCGVGVAQIDEIATETVRSAEALC